MGFKLGKTRGNYCVNGNVRSKLKFGNKAGDPDVSVPGTPVIRKKLEPGVYGEANMDGSIFISDQIEPGSFQERQTIIHEMRHATDIKVGKLAYTDDCIFYNGEKFPRKEIDGVDSILVDGEWREAGDTDFPWENDANNGNAHNIITD